MNKKVLCFIIALEVLTACSSAPKNTGPEWTHQPTRVLDNGYIVYVGTANASSPERAQFKAEGLALEDLANECSMVPQGARIEDRYATNETHEAIAYVKLAVELQECNDAQKALTPEAIRKVASTSFTAQLKKYQDLEETGEMPDSSESAQVVVENEVEPPPTVAYDPSPTPAHFYVMRQYVAYQKEVVILSPPTAYAPGSPATQSFNNHVIPVAQNVQQTQTATPVLRDQAWSHVPNRPVVNRPSNLSHKTLANAPAVHPPNRRFQQQGRRQGRRAAAPPQTRRARKAKRHPREFKENHP